MYVPIGSHRFRNRECEQPNVRADVEDDHTRPAHSGDSFSVALEPPIMEPLQQLAHVEFVIDPVSADAADRLSPLVRRPERWQLRYESFIRPIKRPPSEQPFEWPQLPNTRPAANTVARTPGKLTVCAYWFSDTMFRASLGGVPLYPAGRGASATRSCEPRATASLIARTTHRKSPPHFATNLEGSRRCRRYIIAHDHSQ